MLLWRGPQKQADRVGELRARARRARPFEGMAWRALISRRLHELRIVCCPESPASAPVRSFLANNYEGLKTLNPKFPFLVRTGEADPYFLATYGYGHTEKKSLAGLDEAEVAAALRDLVALGEKHPRSWAASEDLPPAVVKAV